MLKKILLFTLAIVIVLIGCGVAYLFLRKPAMAPASSIKVDMSDANIARGKYLFNTVCDCNGCHSEKDFSRFGGPVIESGRGKGSVFPPELGLPGTVVAANITPDIETGLGGWTDGEKIRAIREGVDRTGRALFPMMPYEHYRHMSDGDVQAIVAFMNALPPIKNALPATEIKFPVNLMIQGAPRPVKDVPNPDRNDRMKYGEYLATIAACIECHTPAEKGQLDRTKLFAGGRKFQFPAGSVISANITPDLETGIGKWSEQQFLDKIYQYRRYVENGSPKVGPESFTLMPWLEYCQMPPEDLGAIYTYLKTRTPVTNSIEKHPEPPKPVG